MNRLPRSALGFIVAIAVIPVILSAVPDGLTSQMHQAANGLDEIQKVAKQITDIQSVEHGLRSPETRPLNSEVPEPATMTASTSQDSLVGSSTSTIIPDKSGASSTTQPGFTASKPESTEPSTTTNNPSTNTSTQTTTTTVKSSNLVEGAITGNACPCTVTGTVELKGNISLQGDLVVQGGTLIARSGVNLNGNGYQILFIAGGRADFQGTPVFTWSENGSRQNLIRDIVFRDMRRIIFMGAGPSTLRFITVMDSGTPNLGDYPLHWHVNGDSTRGTLVEGVVVLNGAHHAFVPHGSHGITFKDTIAKNTAGDAYWWDPGRGINCSNEVVYDHALADHVTNAPGDNRGFRLSAFRLGCGEGNTVKNSVARNVDPSNPKDCAGFHWPENDEGVWVFKNNSSIGSACNGIFVWQNTSRDHIVDGFSGDKVDNGAYVNLYRYLNLDVSEVENHALGRSGGELIFDGGSVGLFRMTKHVLEGGPVRVSNMTIGTFRIEDAGGEPGTYILENVNIGCGDIEYADAHPGSLVTIDGKTC